MPAYRFCRPDDIPLLVRAVNDCYNVHSPDVALPHTEPFTVEGFRAEMKELSVWPSNSMVALAGDEPIAVLIGTKRENEVMISRLGVRPDHLRQGHAAHLVTSLGQKLAVLGPPRLTAEVPADLKPVVEFFEAVGYRRETRYVDWNRPASPAQEVPDELVIPITVPDLLENDLLTVAEGAAWERTRRTLVDRKYSLEGLAIATPERIEAYLLYLELPDRLEVVGSSCREESHEVVYLGLLLRDLIGRDTDLPVRLPRLAEGEIPREVLAGLGFRPGRAYDLYSTKATPA